MWDFLSCLLEWMLNEVKVSRFIIIRVYKSNTSWNDTWIVWAFLWKSWNAYDLMPFLHYFIFIGFLLCLVSWFLNETRFWRTGTFPNVCSLDENDLFEILHDIGWKKFLRFFDVFHYWKLLTQKFYVGN